MPMAIAILDDSLERCSEMLAVLKDRFHQFDIRCFQTPAEMIEFLEQRDDEIIAISLDHDLEPTRTENGSSPDPGTGRDVSRFLAGRKPVCPVIIHTTNVSAAAAMKAELEEAGWTTDRVYPMNDLQWIAEEWFPVMRRVIVDSAVLPSRAVTSPATDSVA
jgi:hypothetical protein